MAPLLDFIPLDVWPEVFTDARDNVYEKPTAVDTRSIRSTQKPRHMSFLSLYTNGASWKERKREG